MAAAEAPPTMEALDRLYRPEALDVPVLVAARRPDLDARPAVGGRASFGTACDARVGRPSAGLAIPAEGTPPLTPQPQVVAEAAAKW